jgi:hypothetical protein
MADAERRLSAEVGESQHRLARMEDASSAGPGCAACVRRNRIGRRSGKILTDDALDGDLHRMKGGGELHGRRHWSTIVAGGRRAYLAHDLLLDDPLDGDLWPRKTRRSERNKAKVCERVDKRHQKDRKAGRQCITSRVIVTTFSTLSTFGRSITTSFSTFLQIVLHINSYAIKKSNIRQVLDTIDGLLYDPFAWNSYGSFVRLLDTSLLGKYALFILQELIN